jgi:tungstate transport system ATP-binding protein
VLFLDEPTASLDPKASRAVEEIVRDIHARGTTIVMTTYITSRRRSAYGRRRVPHEAGWSSSRRPGDFSMRRGLEAATFLEGERL